MRPAALLGAFSVVFAAGAVDYSAAFSTPHAAAASSFRHRARNVCAACQEMDNDITSNEPTLTRSEALRQYSTTMATATAAVVLSTTTTSPSPAWARGRATLEQSYDRYVPRITAGGDFYKGDFRKLIELNDWEGIRRATAEPPKKARKEDRSKPDGGIADRAAMAGAFSDARVLLAADLYASAFSDNSISAKTQEMRTKVAKLREIVKSMNTTARKALGEDDDSGGFFGLGGGKKPSKTELAKQMRVLYVQGGTLWNEYIFAANKELPLRFEKLPYLQ